MLDVAEWEYLAQGGRHVVFRHTGDSKEWKGNVVRFLKASGVSREADEKEVAETIEWLKREMLADVEGCMDVPAAVKVGEGVAEAFSKLCGEELAAAADTMPDYTICDILLEVKPKKGVIFTTDSWCDRGVFIPSGDTLRKKCCKHCMQQSLKLGKGKIQTVSSFCPCNLFQGSTEASLRHMFEVPQNSLSIRINGDLADPTSIPKDAQTRMINEAMIGLRTSNVLSKLLTIQRRIPLDIESIHRARQRKSVTIHYAPSERIACDAEGLRSGSAALPSGYEETRPLPDTVKTVTLKEATESYFISRSAQDCSIMIQLFNDPSVAPICRIIDLDKKPSRKYDFWYAQDRNLVSAFRDSIQSNEKKEAV
eukprot:TRINITY_DN2242_c2_g2_i1.p1 TRINITY_DN2242_c2_g2~~TRINITY_DN2242_c2_g2_i1.p1  ORF type:complete len:367 (+),score=59.37 TRINITY_DN2242_c2_g2_i1:53-1153(+)